MRGKIGLIGGRVPGKDRGNDTGNPRRNIPVCLNQAGYIDVLNSRMQEADPQNERLR